MRCSSSGRYDNDRPAAFIAWIATDSHWVAPAPTSYDPAPSSDPSLSLIASAIAGAIPDRPRTNAPASPPIGDSASSPSMSRFMTAPGSVIRSITVDAALVRVPTMPPSA